MQQQQQSVQAAQCNNGSFVLCQWQQDATTCYFFCLLGLMRNIETVFDRQKQILYSNVLKFKCKLLGKNI